MVAHRSGGASGGHHHQQQQQSHHHYPRQPALGSDWDVCYLCNVKTGSQHNYHMHVNGQAHRRRMGELHGGMSYQGPPMAAPPNHPPPRPPLLPTPPRHLPPPLMRNRQAAAPQQQQEPGPSSARRSDASSSGNSQKAGVAKQQQPVIQPAVVSVSPWSDTGAAAAVPKSATAVSVAPSPRRVLDLAMSGAKTRKERRIWEDIVGGGVGGGSSGGRSRSLGGRSDKADAGQPPRRHPRSRRPDPSGEDDPSGGRQADHPHHEEHPATASASAESEEFAAESSVPSPPANAAAPPVVAGIKAEPESGGAAAAAAAAICATDVSSSSGCGITGATTGASLAVQRMQMALELSLQEDRAEAELLARRPRLAELRRQLAELSQAIQDEEDVLRMLSEKRDDLTARRLAILKESCLLQQTTGTLTMPPDSTATDTIVRQQQLLQQQLPPPEAPAPAPVITAAASAMPAQDPATLKVIRRIMRSECSKELTFEDMDRLIAEEMAKKAGGRHSSDTDDDHGDDEAARRPPVAVPATSASAVKPAGNACFSRIAQSLKAASTAVFKSEPGTSASSAAAADAPNVGSKAVVKKRGRDDVEEAVASGASRPPAGKHARKSEPPASQAPASRSRQTSSSSSSLSSSDDSPVSQQRQRKATSSQRQQPAASAGPLALPGDFQAHNSEQVICALISNGFLFTGSADGSARRFSLQTHECLSTYRRGAANCRVNCMVITNRGCTAEVFRLYSGGSDAVLTVHNTRSGELLKRCSLDSHLWAACHRVDIIYLGLGSGRVAKYDLNSSTLLEGWLGCDGPVACLEMTQCEGRKVVLVGCQNEKHVIVRDERNGILLFTVNLPGPPLAVRCPGFNQRIFHCLTESRLDIAHIGSWDQPFRQVTTEGLGLRQLSLHVGVRGSWMFLGCSDGSVRCHRLGTGGNANGSHHLVVWASPQRNGITAVEFFETARCILAGDSRGRVTVTPLPKLTSPVFPCRWAECEMAFLTFEDLQSHWSRVHVGEGGRCQWRGCSAGGLPGDPHHLRHLSKAAVALARI